MIISADVSGLFSTESAFYCSPRCLIVTQRLVGAELMTAVVGLMMPFRHLNHILNINDPFTLSRAEDDDTESFSGSFISSHTVLFLRPLPQATSGKKTKKIQLYLSPLKTMLSGGITPGPPPHRRLDWLVNETHLL